MNYDIKDPREYGEMYWNKPREIYMRKHWRHLVYRVIRKYCKNKNVLDLGCGIGTYTQYAKRWSKLCLGLDLSRRWLKYAKSKASDLDLICADAHNIPLRDRSLDIVVSVGLLEYVERVIVIREMKRILTHGGKLIVSVPNKYSAYRYPAKLFCKLFRKEYIPKEPSMREMLDLFQINGFSLIGCKMDDGLIWLPDFLDKWLGQKIYLLLEKLFRVFGYNPFSNIMLFVLEKPQKDEGIMLGKSSIQ